MIYDSNIKQHKYSSNIKVNNQNYSVTLNVLKDKSNTSEKLLISIKYSDNSSGEIHEYNNSYSYHQLQILNKYFSYFDSLENICKDLDKLLKKNKVAIEVKSGSFIILAITVLMKREKTDIIFKLLKNKITDCSQNKSKIKSPHNSLNNYSNANSMSMPKYNKNNTKELNTIINSLNNRLSTLENERYYNTKKSRNNNKINNNENNLLSNMNDFISRINRLEDINQEKEKKIKTLEDKINKYEDNLSNTMSYPLYSLNDKNQISRNDNKYKKKKQNSNSDNELDVNSNFKNQNSMNKSKDTLRSKKKTKIEEKKGEFNDNNTLSGKKSLKNKNKKESNFSRSRDSNDDNENETKNHRNNNNKNKGNSSNSLEKESDDNKKNKFGEKKRNKRRNKEEKKVSDIKEYNEKNDDSSSEKEKINKKRSFSYDSNSSDKIMNKKKRKNISNSTNKINKNIDKEKEKSENKEKTNISNISPLTGLPMVERDEDLEDFVNSRIFFTRNELQLIKKKIVGNNIHKHSYFEILYRASVDDDFEANIISCCEGKYPQLILFYTEEGARFGVYIDKQKSTNFFGSVSYKEVPGTAFLISLNNLKIYDIMEGKKATDDRIEKLCFGRSFYFNNNESNWFIYTPRNYFLGTKCMLGDKESSFGNINANDIAGYKKDYILKEVEIFKVVVYTGGVGDDDDDKYVREKEIKIRNFSKKKGRNKEDIIIIKNIRIEREENDDN